MCESCGICFAKPSWFKRHFKTKHFVEEARLVETTLEIPAKASTSLRRKIDELATVMATRRKEHGQACLSARIDKYQTQAWVNEEVASTLKDIGRMIKQEFGGGEDGRSAVVLSVDRLTVLFNEL